MHRCPGQAFSSIHFDYRGDSQCFNHADFMFQSQFTSINRFNDLNNESDIDYGDDDNEENSD